MLGSPRHLKDQYGTEYRIRLTAQQPSLDVPSPMRLEDNGEYSYPKTNLSHPFKILQQLVDDRVIAPNYTVQLPSLEHLFLKFQHPAEDTQLRQIV